jgi:hypothetical protein
MFELGMSGRLIPTKHSAGQDNTIHTGVRQSSQGILLTLESSNIAPIPYPSCTVRLVRFTAEVGPLDIAGVAGELLGSNGVLSRAGLELQATSLECKVSLAPPGSDEY